MQSRKAVNIWATLIVFALLYAGATFVFYKYFGTKAHESEVLEPLNMLDSLGFKYDLNIDSLRKDSTFTKMLTVDLTEDDIYTKMLSYTDEEVIARFKDTTQQALTDTLQFFPTDSMRKIMAEKDIMEEKLTEYITNNTERFNLLKEKKGLVKEVSTLQKQIDTISTKTETVISKYKSTADSLSAVAKENSLLKEQANELKGQNFAELVRKYEAMKPLQAAKILEDMPDLEVVKLLKKMNNRQAGKILTALPPEKAASLSLLIMQDKSDLEKVK